MPEKLKPFPVFWGVRIFIALLFICLGVGGAAKTFSSAGATASLDILIPRWSQSYQIYRQPHAIWLDRYKHVGDNLPELERALSTARLFKQTPELVIYAIPLRDLGQSSEGGFINYEDYLTDNQLSAKKIREHIQNGGKAPVVYLEPDSIPLAVQYRRDHHGNAESHGIFAARVRVTKTLITLYKDAGANVYLEAGHSGWFDYGDEDIQRIADALNEAGIALADGLTTNVSNRQPIFNASNVKSLTPNTEAHYLSRLLPRLHNAHLDIRVDTSRNGGTTYPRCYTLEGWKNKSDLASQGKLIDNETKQGRLVGQWLRDKSGIVTLKPFFGNPKKLSRLLEKEKYTFEANSGILMAPPWLDAVGDVQPGPAPTNSPPSAVSTIIQHYRYIKPPDDCDGALNFPPGESKKRINQETAKRQ